MVRPVTRNRPDRVRTPWVDISPQSERILDRGWELVQSVPYKVSLRWVFYKLLGEGYYKDKEDYFTKAKKLFSRARHTSFKNWRPDTLMDDTRTVSIRTGGYIDKDEAEGQLREDVIAVASISIDHFYRQENYIELWYEAHAMTGQFEYYTHDIDLVPMGGSASIPYKWRIAQRLKDAALKYGKPVKILYFGDEDTKGHAIKTDVERDARRWAYPVEFEVIWCGLTMDQVRQYELPEGLDRPGYQWEALPDAAARDIITMAVRQYIDMALIAEAEAEAMEFEDKWTTKLEDALDRET